MPLRPPELCCRAERPPEADALSGIPREKNVIINKINKGLIKYSIQMFGHTFVNLVYIFHLQKNNKIIIKIIKILNRGLKFSKFVLSDILL